MKALTNALTREQEKLANARTDVANSIQRRRAAEMSLGRLQVIIYYRAKVLLIRCCAATFCLAADFRAGQVTVVVTAVPETNSISGSPSPGGSVSNAPGTARRRMRTRS